MTGPTAIRKGKSLGHDVVTRKPAGRDWNPDRAWIGTCLSAQTGLHNLLRDPTAALRIGRTWGTESCRLLLTLC
jgi:hypothetical protein